MTVQELIDALNKVEDKSKIVRQYNLAIVRTVGEHDGDVLLY